MLLSDIADDIEFEAPEAIGATLDRAVLFAVQTFYRKSEAWRHREDVAMDKGTNTYALTLPAGSYILAADFVYYEDPASSRRTRLTSTLPERVNDELTGPAQEFYTTRTSVVVNPDDESGTLDCGVILCATKSITAIPDDHGDSWFEFFRAGALAKLLNTAGKPWTNRKAGAQYYDVFYDGINEARREARNDRSRPKRTVQFNTGFRW